MSDRSSFEFGPAVTEGFGAHLTEFLATLATAGYAEKTRHDKRRLIVPFIRWVGVAQLAVGDVDEACVGAFLARPSRRRCKHGDPERATLHQFLEHLRTVGVAPPRRLSEPSPAEVLVGNLEDLRRRFPGQDEQNRQALTTLLVGELTSVVGLATQEDPAGLE